MTDAADEGADSGAGSADAAERDADADSVADAADDGGDARESSEDLEALRRRVEEEYDFEDFGPADMASMEPEEWDAAFDPDTWITGEPLLDRVEADLKHRVATRDVFAVIERTTHDGEPAVLAYTDNGYALVEPDGSVEGFGTVLRDTRPVVALCSMDSYDVPEPPSEDYLLPAPDEVPTGSDELGNLMMQIVAAVLSLCGLALVLAALYVAVAGIGGLPTPGGVTDAGGGALAVTFVIGFSFVLIGLLLFTTVANARLSDRFRAEEYRDRLRRMGLEDGERPDFLPVEGRTRELSEEDRGDA